MGRRIAEFSRRAAVVLRNIFELVVRDAFRNWARHPRTLTPALGSMILLLLLAGVGSLGGLAVRNVLEQEAAQASILNVYLKDSASSQQVARLGRRFAADHRVASVSYISKQQALHDFRTRPGLGSLVSD